MEAGLPVGKVVFSCENICLFPQATGASLLALNGLGGDCQYAHILQRASASSSNFFEPHLSLHKE